MGSPATFDGFKPDAAAAAGKDPFVALGFKPDAAPRDPYEGIKRPLNRSEGAAGPSVFESASERLLKPIREAPGAIAHALNPMNIPETVKGIVDNVVDHGRQAVHSAENVFAPVSWTGRPTAGQMGHDLVGRGLSAMEAGGHALAMIPGIGSGPAHAAETAAHGDLAGAAGEMAVVGGSVLAPELLKTPLVRGAASGVTDLAKSGATQVARLSVPGRNATLAETALQNRVLPGFFRTGAQRAAARSGAASDAAAETLLGPHGATPVSSNLGGGPQVAKTWRMTAGQLAPGEDLASAARAFQMQNHPLVLGPTMPAARMFDLAEGTSEKMLGKTGVRPDMERAIASDSRDAVGRAVPEVAKPLQKVNDLAPLREAFTKESPRQFDLLHPVKTAVDAARRVVPPVTQGVYSAARAAADISPETYAAIVRAAILAQLTGKGDSR